MESLFKIDIMFSFLPSPLQYFPPPSTSSLLLYYETFLLLLKTLFIFKTNIHVLASENFLDSVHNQLFPVTYFIYHFILLSLNLIIVLE